MTNTYREVIGDDESLSKFLKAMSDFDKAFCQVMIDGLDYTLRLEIHGNAGRLVHCRVTNDNFNRPRGSEVRVGKNRRLVSARESV